VACGGLHSVTRYPLSTADVWRMIRRRTKLAGIKTKIGCHTFRAAGITNYLKRVGALGDVQYLLGRAEPRTTSLRDRRKKKLTKNIRGRISI
jgi:integrase/recombinase XerD